MTIAQCLSFGTLAFFTTPVQAAPDLGSKTVFPEPAEFDSPFSEVQLQPSTYAFELVESFAEAPFPGQTVSSQPLNLAFPDLPSHNDLTKFTAQDLLPSEADWAVPRTEIPLPQPAPALAQVRPGAAGEGWEFVIEPSLFVPLDIQTGVTVGGITETVSVGLGDIFSLDRVYSAALRLEARQPNYGFFVDASHIFARDGRTIIDYPLPPILTDLVNVVSPTPIQPGTPFDVGVTATGRVTTIDLGGYYRVVDQYLGRTSTNQPTYPRLLFDPFLGARISLLSGSLDFDVDLGNSLITERSLDESITLIKPLLGGQLSLELSDQWGLGLRGDVSGLGIGGDEVLAWSVLAGARYRFSPSVALQLAYEYKDSNYRFGEGTTQFGIDQAQHGLWVGFDVAI